MAYKNIILPVTGSFTAGFSLAYLLYKKDLTINKPLLAANSTDIMPYPNSGLKTFSKDDLAINKSARIAEMMKHGYPSLDNLRVFEDFVLSYDRRTRVPNWVFEHLTKAKLRAAEDTDRGKSEFKEDTAIHSYFRSTNKDYKYSGYDRGHLAAAANHRLTQNIMDETFYLSNMAPQVGVGFNRDKWNDLEREVRKLTKNNDNVWVCSGPLFLPRREEDGKHYVKYEVIGQQNVAVPTHFFKVVITERNGEYHLSSYVLPNAKCPNETPLSSYLVPIDSIERAAGFLLYDRIPKNKLKSVNKI